MAISAIFGYLVIHHIEVPGPLLDCVQTQQVLGGGPCQIIFVHAYFVEILQFLRLVTIHLPVLHFLYFLDQAVLVQCVERHVIVAQLQNNTPERPDVCPVIITDPDIAIGIAEIRKTSLLFCSWQSRIYLFTLGCYSVYCLSRQDFGALVE